MKSIGMVRKVNELGRIVVPMELRRTMDIKEKDPLEIYVDDDKIILKKHESGCMFCENAEELIPFRGKLVCEKCIEELAKRKG